jgi:hypothetical protein
VSERRDFLGGHDIDETACTLDGRDVSECQNGGICSEGIVIDDTACSLGGRDVRKCPNGGICSEGMTMMIQRAHGTEGMLASVRTEGFVRKAWH